MEEEEGEEEKRIRLKFLLNQQAKLAYFKFLSDLFPRSIMKPAVWL